MKTFALLAVSGLVGCVSVPESQTVRVTGVQHAAPTGCQELSPVSLTDERRRPKGGEEKRS